MTAGLNKSSSSGSNEGVVSCRACQAPVVQTAASCPSCSAPLNGQESPYILRREAGPNIAGLVKWWGIWSLVIWALAGFSFGTISSLVFTGVTCVYLIRILRAYYS